jgi:hypothetical protein
MTNAARWALDLMAARLGNPFHDTVSADDALCEKPDPQYFAFARGRISRDGIVKNEILHVAQSQYHDIGVAMSLGYTVCWVERRQGMAGSGGTITAAERTVPHYHVATLAELADLAEASGCTCTTDRPGHGRAGLPRSAGSGVSGIIRCCDAPRVTRVRARSAGGDRPCTAAVRAPHRSCGRSVWQLRRPLVTRCPGLPWLRRRFHQGHIVRFHSVFLGRPVSERIFY